MKKDVADYESKYLVCQQENRRREIYLFFLLVMHDILELVLLAFQIPHSYWLFMLSLFYFCSLRHFRML